ncbi:MULTISPECIES: thioredoxin domain-containing protein [Rhodomicrobium]|uniref:thioredoxin domain-containing protein n=1 Tax=Rhodomicrobium TaxID=1068 RepID=UPI000B4A5A82|nr:MULTISPECIES: thioredoxin domain-containing protein [Rhodomicrobium]
MSYNRLSQETSPYLLQHKDNPVDWWPWGEEAFAEAQRLGKPVLLSVGYAACHWCHVMAHESFEDAGTARVMNELFVNIKVDREERPDVDALYMNALHQLGEQGGWPLTMFLTPTGEPFWGGTYFPKQQIYGRPPFTHVLREISRIHREEPDKIRQNAEALKAAIQPKIETAAEDNLNENTLADLASRLAQALDPVNGGLSGAPKFPNAVILGFLWKLGLRQGIAACTDGVENALVHIAQGGIYDHLGGGFARYSVDERWLVPHFEKMLYDNALLIDLMTEVWKERRHPLLEGRVAETVEWLLSEMVAPDGGFASSYDADSEGVEGKFYVWSRDEIVSLLGEKDAALFAEIYDVSEHGNWEETNILNRLRSMELLSPAEEEKLQELRAKLFEARKSRVAPGWDDKVLADWNGLAIAALVNAGQTFGERRWVEAAIAAYDFIGKHMSKDGRLLHSYRAGQAKTPAVASDYANMIAAAIALYLATGDAAKLKDAERWTQVMQAQYWAEPDGGYYLSAADTSDIIIRTLSARDDAVPNANAVMLGNLVALHTITGETRYRDLAEALRRGLVGEALRLASLHTGFFSALSDHFSPQHVVLMRGAGEEAMLGALNHLSLTGTVVEWLDEDQGAPQNSPAYGKRAVDGKATAYICIGPQCSPPVTAPDALLSALRSSRKVLTD